MIILALLLINKPIIMELFVKINYWLFIKKKVSFKLLYSQVIYQIYFFICWENQWAKRQLKIKSKDDCQTRSLQLAYDMILYFGEKNQLVDNYFEKNTYLKIELALLNQGIS